MKFTITIILMLFSIFEIRAQQHEPYIIWVNPDSIIPKQYLIGDYEPETDTNFTLIDSIYAVKTTFYIQKEVYKAFIAMYEAALSDSIKLTITSATRNCDYQKGLWDDKWQGTALLNGVNVSGIHDPLKKTQTIIKYVAMPQTSRHHWGTDIDLVSADTSFYSTPEGIKIYNWLKLNASTYGFCQPYSLSNQIIFEAYQEEKWHWSYNPLSHLFFKNYKKQISYSDFDAFWGSKYAEQLKVIEKYALRVDPACF